MLDYIKGIVFIIVFISFLAMLGKKVRKSDFFSENLIYGFVIYTCLQFVGGFIAQQFRLPWIYYEIYMIVILIFLFIISIYNNKIKLNKYIVKAHFRKYGLLYIIAFTFVILSCLNIQFQWNANNVDDGYYLNKIRMAPYLKNYTDYNFAVGIPAPGSVIRNVNTFEIEAAFYSYTLGIDASVFAKVFLSFFNFTLLLNVIYLFYMTVLGSKNKVKRLSLALVPMLFFGIYYGIQTNFGLLALNDTWQNITAMWYGSVLVKTAGIFLLVLPIFNKSRLTIKDLMWYACICIALVSKASQMLPIFIIVMMIFILKIMFEYLKNKNFKFAFLFIIFMLICFIFLPITPEIQRRAILISDLLSKNMNILVKVSMFIIALSYFSSNKLLKKWNTWLLLFGAFLFVPKLNTLFLYGSIYDFVASRTVELYIFTVFMTVSFIVYLYLIDKINNDKKILMIYGGIAICLVSIPLISIQRNLGFVNTVEVLIHNPKLIPETTIRLGDKLNALSKDKHTKLNVLMPMWVVIDKTPHALASLVRYNTFDIISLGSIARYKEQTEDSIFKSLDQDTLDIFEKYNSGEEVNDKKLSQVLKMYPINCIVLFNDGAAKRIEDKFGYKKIGEVISYNNDYKYTILFKK